MADEVPEYREPPDWLPGDIFKAELMNIYSGNDRYFKAWVDKLIPQRMINAGPDADKPAEPQVGEIYFATDTGVLYIFDGDVWHEFREVPPELDQHRLKTPIDHPDSSITPEKLDTVNAPQDGMVLAYDAATGKFKWISLG